jgi:syntaxin-binding protein 5
LRGFEPTIFNFRFQHLLAIGTRCGEIRLFGRPGLDMEIRHESDCQVLQIIFLVNEGKLLTACSDDTVNLWDFRKKSPELVQATTYFMHFRFGQSFNSRIIDKISL